MTEARDQWSGRLGFVLAAAGSAVGLGNLWKFPYITWNNDGGAFVLVYLACIVVIGLPVMLSEILVGRRTQRSAVPAFRRLGHPRWSAVGWIGVAAGVVILSFYTVIAGWSLSSFVQCVDWSVSGYQAPAEDAFGNFVSNGPLQVGLGAAFLVITAVTVIRGVSKGIERATKVLMPALFGIMLYLLATVMTMDGFGDAMSFLFTPSFSGIDSHAVLEALGHAFFTLSLGMGAMITYGSYVKKDESIVSIGLVVALLDTVIALMACAIMFSIIFSVPSLHEQMKGGGGGSSAGMLFVTLPQLFYTEMSGGTVIGPLFYLLVGFAALSSTISLLEVIVATCVDRLSWSRAKAVAVSTGVVFTFSIGCALSLGGSEFFSTLRLFGSEPGGLNHIITGDKAGLLNIFDHLSANWFLPVGGLLITIFTGWVLDPKESAEELGGRDGIAFKLWQVSVRFVCPIAIGWIIVSVITGGDFT
jgi:NSS family neurotransmitter:Na+ symporter